MFGEGGVEKVSEPSTMNLNAGVEGGVIMSKWGNETAKCVTSIKL